MSSLQKKTLYSVFLITFILSCKEKSSSLSNIATFETFPRKTYVRDNTTGDMISTEMDTSDFHSSDNCVECHFNHVEEWKHSMHSYSMRDPIFFSGWYKERTKREHTGERFCIQCHSPVAYLTGIKLDQYSTVDELQNDPELSMSIKEGVTCTVCHSFTGTSGTTEIEDDVAARAEYYMNPGEGIMYGPLETKTIECVEGMYCHDVQYNNLFKFSESCLPCHNMTVRGTEVEMTFSEWNSIPQFGMAGLVPCQDCHMPMKKNNDETYYHSHEFLGVDLDLTKDITEDSDEYQNVKKLLQKTLKLEFGGKTDEDSIRIINTDTLIVPITISSITGHSFPSGTSFSRESWLETIITDTQNDLILFKSGVIDNSTDSLRLDDESLLIYSSYLLDENGNTTNSVTDAYDIDRQMLLGLESDIHTYIIDGVFVSGMQIKISARMRFRAFKPHLLAEAFLSGNSTFEECDICKRQPVFNMANIDTMFTIP